MVWRNKNLNLHLSWAHSHVLIHDILLPSSLPQLNLMMLKISSLNGTLITPTLLSVSMEVVMKHVYTLALEGSFITLLRCNNMTSLFAFKFLKISSKMSYKPFTVVSWVAKIQNLMTQFPTLIHPTLLTLSSLPIISTINMQWWSKTSKIL